MAAFDFDGTLVAGDSLAPFLRILLGPRSLAVAAAAGPAMARAYRGAGRDGAKAALLVRAAAGLDAEVVAEQGRAYAVRLEGRVRPDMRTAVDNHRRAGHRLILVSASLAAYLEPFGRLVGFDQVIATRLEMGVGGRLTGRLLGANVRGAEKELRLRAALGDAPVELWAYGDSSGDREMLAMADHPHLLRRRRGGI